VGRVGRGRGWHDEFVFFFEADAVMKGGELGGGLLNFDELK
jgi:hypothetical protein